MYFNTVGRGVQIRTEDDILDIDVRKQIIKDICGEENRARKSEAFRRYHCYKDGTSQFVMEQLLKQFDFGTVEEMRYCIANISIVRKVIDKLARVYSNGVERKIGAETAQNKALEEAVRSLQLDTQMKKTNRWLKLFMNTLFYVAPKRLPDGKMTLKPGPLAPYLYDVIEDPEDREQPMVVILSDYQNKPVMQYSTHPATEGRPLSSAAPAGPANGVDETIADRPEDTANHDQQFIWWSGKYHFTTNYQGVIQPPEVEVPAGEENKNPIQELPFENFARDQDGSFYALGGDDLIDGAVLVNCMLSHVNNVGVVQGYGQLVMKGKNLPKGVKVGPNKVIRLEWNKAEEDPEPSFEFVSANPPLNELRGLLEMYVALLLTTNNLSTSGVASQLNGGGSFPSAIAMVIDKAESMEDVNDQQQIFRDKEPLIFKKIAKWYSYFKTAGLLPDKAVVIDETIDFSKLEVRFGLPKPVETDKERLEVIELRLKLKLITHLEAIKADNPNMTDDQAKQRLKEILEEAMERAAQGLNNEEAPVDKDGNPVEPGEEGEPTNEGEAGVRKPKPNERPPGPGAPKDDES